MAEREDEIDLLVAGRRMLSADIAEFTLVAANGAALPGAGAGAHITLRTPSGAMRRYSLLEGGDRPERYRIAVKREPASRGGSASMHEELAEGDRIAAEPPVNDFPLRDAPEYLLIAGGIGVTPIRAMAAALSTAEKPFRVIYCASDAESAACLDELQALCGDRLTAHFDGGDPARFYDFWDHFETPTKARIYCCGPAPLMEEIKAISGHWPEGSVSFEDFKPVEVVRADDVAFKVKLARTGDILEVPADRTILETVRAAGVTKASSCESGTCGTCKCRLIEGEADHRDMVLLDEERASHIMICVSRALQGDLVIDL